MDFEKKVFRVDQMTAQPNGGVNGVISLVDASGEPWTPGGDASVAWGDVTGKPSTFAPTIGTTATTAAAGNHTHAFSALAGSVSDATGANLQAILEDLAGRIADLEEPAG